MFIFCFAFCVWFAYLLFGFIGRGQYLWALVAAIAVAMFGIGALVSRKQ